MTETTSAGELNSCSTSWCVQPQAALSSKWFNFYDFLFYFSYLFKCEKKCLFAPSSSANDTPCYLAS